MRNSGWSGDRRPRNRIMLITVPLVVTMAVGLIVGIRLVSEKNATLRLSNTGQGTANSTPAPPATSPPAASPGATPSPAATATPTATPTATATGMSCVRISLSAPSSRPAAAGCAAAGTPSRGAGTASGGARTAGRGAGTAGAARSAAVLTARRGPSTTAAAKGV
jgi:hypothetical protein